MNHFHTFSYLPVAGTQGILPLLPVTLEYEGCSMEAHALVDSGASVNVLPKTLGLRLGLEWEKQKHALELGGNLARQEARGVLLLAIIKDFPPVRLAFAWSASDDTRLILGQTNFFLAFDVLFRRADLAFDLKRR